MTFSLIVATIGRASELSRLLDSLDAQTYQSFEVIIVDQNPTDILGPILGAHPGLTIKRVESPKGLSRARNLGVAAASGDIVAFPDDDCWYPADMLGRVSDAFAKHGADGITIMARDESGEPCGGAHWDRAPGIVTRRNVWRRAISIGVFVHLAQAKIADGFDETLGAGSGTPFGAGEETDFLLKIIEKGGQIYYEPGIHALHPSLRKGDGEGDIQRAYSYGLGLGLVLRRHHYPVSVALTTWVRSAGGMVLSLLKLRPSRARFYRAALMGKIGGWRAGASK
jgi:glycosyltransferase involved in cell wall biosynthesis